jgi:hypothetical protein
MEVECNVKQTQSELSQPALYASQIMKDATCGRHARSGNKLLECNIQQSLYCFIKLVHQLRPALCKVFLASR